jgi:acyl CoA:acetate/3-ketoacid CoA transferase beta subunit
MREAAMEPQTVIARRIAQELKPGMLVNLGIGIPTLVAKLRARGHACFLSIGEWADRDRHPSRRGNGASDLN